MNLTAVDKQCLPGMHLKWYAIHKKDGVTFLEDDKLHLGMPMIAQNMVLVTLIVINAERKVFFAADGTLFNAGFLNHLYLPHIPYPSFMPSRHKTAIYCYIRAK